MDSLTRRAFLEKLSALTAGGTVANAMQDAFGAGRSDESPLSEPHIAFPNALRDRISVASYSFRAYIESPANSERDRTVPGMDLADFAAEVAKKFNVHNIEPHNRHFRSLDPAYLGSFREALGKAGAYGAGKNVVVNLENDDLVSEDAFFLVKGIEAVNNPYLHALPDFANAMQTGNADFNYRALEATSRSSELLASITARCRAARAGIKCSYSEKLPGPAEKRTMPKEMPYGRLDTTGPPISTFGLAAWVCRACMYPPTGIATTHGRMPVNARSARFGVGTPELGGRSERRTQGWCGCQSLRELLISNPGLASAYQVPRDTQSFARSFGRIRKSTRCACSAAVSRAV